eukprot:72241-Alexandrium_andersonii.AAC.1
MRVLEGEQASHIDAMLADAPIAQADASGQDAAQLLVAYVHRQPGPDGIGGQIVFKHGPAEPL